MNLYNIILAFSFQEIAIILLIVLLLFGGRKIPELMRGLGSGIKEFKNASKKKRRTKKKKNNFYQFLTEIVDNIEFNSNI